MEADTWALVWFHSEDPEAVEALRTPLGAARFVVLVAAPRRWSWLLLTPSDVDRAARAIVADREYRRDIGFDAWMRLEAESSRCGDGRKQLRLARNLLDAAMATLDCG